MRLVDKARYTIPMTVPLIAFKSVSKKYGDNAALSDVSFELCGRSIGLVGPNGAGKTTLMKICLGLANVTSGQVEVLGKRITKKTANRMKLGFAAEGAGHLPHLTGLECVAYAGRLCGLPKRQAYLRAHEMLDLVGLDEARHRVADTYSTGMLQRTKVAMALVHDPDILFLDEPTSGLDPTSRAELLSLLVHLRDGGGPAVVLSTHILNDVEKACDQVLILEDGRVNYSGGIRHLITTALGSVRVRLLMQSDAFAQGLTDGHLKWRMSSAGVYLVQTPGTDQIAQIWAIAAKTNASIIGLEPVHDGFADAFLSQLAGER